MEFFNWVLIAELFYVLATVTQSPSITSLQQQLYVGVGVAAGIFVVCLILGGVGLTQIAKKQGIKPSVLAYLPFGNTYFAGKVAGEAYFFGQKMKRAGLYAMIAEIAYAILNTLYYVFDSMLLPHGEFVQSGESITFEYVKIPENLQWAYNALTPLNALSYIAEIAMFVFFFVVFLALFKKYYAKRPVLMTVLSAIFPFRAFVLFAVRNNEPYDYDAYLRRRAEEYARRTYGNPPQGGYGNPPQGGQGGQSAPSPDPFGEFGGGSGSGEAPPPPSEGNGGSENPFSDF